VFIAETEPQAHGGNLISLVQSCHSLKIEPLLYLRHVLAPMSTDLASRIAFLPDAWKPSGSP
jgi:hypothetical protein